VPVGGALGARSLALAGAGADSIHGTLLEQKHDEYSKKAEEKEATQAQPRLNQPSSNTKNPVVQTSQQDTPPASDDEDKVKQWLAVAGREPEHAKVEGIRDSVLVKDDLETTYRYLDSYNLGEEDDDEIPQKPQCPVPDQKDEDVPGPTASHQPPLTPPPEITQTMALDQPVLQPEWNQVLVHTPVLPPPLPPKTPSAPSSHVPPLPTAQVHPSDQAAPVTQGNHQAEGFSTLMTPDMTPPAPVYPEPPVQQSTVPALPE
jgi:hypothetical protein